MRAKFSEKVCYSISALTYNLEMGCIAAYMSLYCTDVLYLKPAIIGAIFLLPRFLDAITDLIVTNLADKTQTRLGKYRPWLFSGIMLALCFVLFFYTPSFLDTELKKIIWVLVIYIFMVPIAETMYMCPMTVMGTVMSPDSKDRLDFATARTLGENAADFIMNALCMTIILSFGSYHNPLGWRRMAFVFAAIMIVSTIIGIAGTKERVVVNNKDQEGNELNLWIKLRSILSEKAYIKLIIIDMGGIFAWICCVTLFPYFCIHGLEHSEWVSVLTTAGVISQIFGTVCTIVLCRKLEKRTVIGWGSLIVAIAAVFVLFINSFVGALLFQILKGIGLGFVLVLIWAYLPDITDYISWKKGMLVPGVAMGIVAFCCKVFTAFSSWVSMTVLELSQYDATLEVQSAFTNQGIRIGLCTTLLISAVIIFTANFSLKELMNDKMRHYYEDMGRE